MKSPRTIAIAAARPEPLDVTMVTNRIEITAAFGERAAWEATIKRLTKKESQETNPQRKRHIRLMLLNAQTQLALLG